MFGCDLRFLKRRVNELSSLSIFIDGCRFEMKNKNCEGLYRCIDRLKQNKIFFYLLYFSTSNVKETKQIESIAIALALEIKKPLILLSMTG